MQIFGCTVEGSSFEIFTDNQVPKCFFIKLKLSRREARWLETLGNYGNFHIGLKPGKIYLLGDMLSRAPHVSVNIPEVLKINIDDVIGGYENDKLYGAVLNCIREEDISEEIKKNI